MNFSCSPGHASGKLSCVFQCDQSWNLADYCVGKVHFDFYFNNKYKLRKGYGRLLTVQAVSPLTLLLHSVGTFETRSIRNTVDLSFQCCSYTQTDTTALPHWNAVQMQKNTFLNYTLECLKTVPAYAAIQAEQFPAGR